MTGQPYKVVVVGLGKRGLPPRRRFKANPRFELVGHCDLDAAPLAKAAAELGDQRDVDRSRPRSAAR